MTVYQKIADPVQAARELGEHIAKSRLLGCESIDQGVVMALECFARGCPPLSLAEEYHIIDGGLSMRADRMLARFIEAGGRHKIKSRTPELASIELTIRGERETFSLSWKNAEAEGLAKGKNGVKTNWSTPRRRMQMLWARVVSDGVRAMAPQCVCGRYTPEDFGVSQDDLEPPAAGTNSDAVVDAEYTVDPEPEPPAKQPQQQPTAPDYDAPGSVTENQRHALRHLIEELGIAPEQQEKILAKRGCSTARNLSANQATDLIAKLTAKLQEKRIDAAAGEGQAADTQRAAETEPATEQQVAEAKRLLAEFEQIKPGTVAKVSQKLKSTGMLKIANLNMAACDLLIQSLQTKKIEAFFDASLGNANP